MKRQTSMVKIFSLYSPDDSYDRDLPGQLLEDQHRAADPAYQGVGEAFTLGADYSMRVWLKPDVMAQYKRSRRTSRQRWPSRTSSRQPVSWARTPKNTFEYTMKYRGRIQTPEKFRPGGYPLGCRRQHPATERHRRHQTRQRILRLQRVIRTDTRV